MIGLGFMRKAMNEKYQRFSGCEALTIDAVAAKSIRIMADSDLRDGLEGVVFLEAQFAEQSEMDAVIIKEGRELVLKGRKVPSATGAGNFFNMFCRSAKVSAGDIVGGRVIVDDVEVKGDSGLGRNNPTLEVSLLVPVGFPVRIIGCGVTEFTVDTRGGRLLAELDGSCSLQVSDVTLPDIETNGACQVAIGRMRDGGRFEANGASRIVVDQADGGDFEVELNGSSNFVIETGTIGKLDAEANGASKLSALVTAERADLEAAGAASIVVSEVTGKVTEDRSGVAKIRVSKRPGADAGTDTKSGGTWWKSWD